MYASSGRAMRLRMPQTLYLIGALLLSATFGQPLSAQQAGTTQVTLAEAVALAETTDVTRDITDLEKQIAAEGVAEARGQRRPRVNLKLEYVQTQQNIISQDNKTFQDGQSQYPVATVTLTVTQPLYDAVRFRQLPLAQAQEALAAANAEAELINMNRELVAAFIRVAQAQNNVRKAERIYQVRTQFSRDVDQMVESGRADIDEQLRAQSDVFSAGTDLADAQAGLSEALFDLHRFTGIEVGGVRGDGFTLADPRSMSGTFSLDTLETMNPAIQIAKAELAVAERQLAEVQARFRPTANVTLEGKYNQSRGSLFGGGSTVSNVDVGLEVNWSIYEGGTRRAQLRVAEHQVAIAKLKIEQAREQARSRYVALMGALEQARSVVGTIAQEQRVSGDRATGAQESLAAGAGSMETVLEAGLRRDVAAIAGATARMRAAQIQAEIFALFGALDTAALSRDFAGG